MVERLLEGEVEKLVHMEERLHRRVVGQDEAVEAVSNALRRARSGLQDPNRPVVIMTSNVRSADALRDVFRPEFLNRIDEIVEFRSLTREQLAAIVELQLERLRARLAERGIDIELTEAAKEHLAEAGWDPSYGARPLKRALQRLVENPLALRLLEGDFAEGDTVLADVREGEVVFEKAASLAEAVA